MSNHFAAFVVAMVYGPLLFFQIRYFSPCVPILTINPGNSHIPH
jgi:hypothetical protein